MARPVRTRAVRGVIGLLVLSSVAASPIPRVSSSNPAIAAVMAKAEASSPTFASLVRTIEGTDGIVYVERGECRHGVRACLTHSIVAGDGYRLLRILVSDVDDVMSLMATIGHELRHVVEVLTEPSVRTSAAVYNYYLRESPTMRTAFETDAAVRAGIQVAQEL